MRAVLGIAIWVLAITIGQASCSRLRATTNGGKVIYASANCIGHTDRGDSILITAAHCLDGAEAVEVYYDKRWRSVRRVAADSRDDVAVLELPGRKMSRFALTERAATRVLIGGFGPEFLGTDEPKTFRGEAVDNESVIGDAGEHVIFGDSGGFVVAQSSTEPEELIGLVTGYEYGGVLRRRDERSTERIRTRFVPAAKIQRCLQRHYRAECPGGGCGIYVRPGVTQPFFGPFPVGPPRPIGVLDPLPPIHLPVPQPVPDALPPAGDSSRDIQSAVNEWLRANAQRIRGPAGDRGPKGDPGEDGRAVTTTEIEATVNAWLDSHRGSLRGPVGPQGPQGPAGKSIGLTESDRQQLVQDVAITIRPVIDQVVAESLAQHAPGDSPSDPPAKPDEERKRLLYFTSTAGCGKCKETDEMVRKLKDRGYPITIIDLDPRETEIKGVPRVYHPSSGRDVLGPIACADYLASVGY